MGLSNQAGFPDRALILFLVSVFALALTPSFAALDVMFIGTAVALNTVVKFADAFLDVLAPDIDGRVFMASVAGVTPVVVAHMAGHAGRIVVLIESKVFVVVEACRCPLLLCVTLNAVALDLLVQGVLGLLVTGQTLISCFLAQKGMVKAALQVIALDSGVIAVTGHAILTDQLLVKRRSRAWLGDDEASCGQSTNVSRFVTSRTQR